MMAQKVIAQKVKAPMRETLTIATGCLNTTPLDIAGNTLLIKQAIAQAVAQGADLLLLPELAITGYGCEDMFYSAQWLEDMPNQVARIAAMVPAHLLVAVGFPLLINGGQLFNAVALLSHKQVHGLVCKQHLARNGIHYEPRWFTAWTPGLQTTLQFAGQTVPVGDLVFSVKGLRIGFEICEDSWVPSRPGRSLFDRQVDVMLNPSASHFALEKHLVRQQFVREGSRAFGVVYVYANLLGCEAGRAIYDGGALIASNGEIVLSGARFGMQPVCVETASVDIAINRAARQINSQAIRPGPHEGLIQVDFDWRKDTANKRINEACPDLQENEADAACLAMSLGLWDWQRKTATAGYAISLSGGADSALCAALVYLAQRRALAALGADAYRHCLAQSGVQLEACPAGAETTWLTTQVMPKLLTCVYQASANSGEVTRHAAETVAQALGGAFHAWDISGIIAGYVDRANALTPSQPMTWETDDIALQNIQARARAPGIWLLANREGKLLLATANLSEASVGYCTMDGDTSGVLAPIGGVSKSRVLRLLRHLSEAGLETPQGRLQVQGLQPILDQQPTAELRPTVQTDEADLMPFDVLDAIRHIAQVQHASPQGVLRRLRQSPMGDHYPHEQLAAWVVRYFRLYCRNQWKRERLAVSFHIEADSADPKTYRRFPVLNSQLRDELGRINDALSANF